MDLPPKPERHRYDSHGALEDAGTLVEPRGHGPEVLDCVDRPLDFIPSLVDRLVEAIGPAAAIATALSVGPLVARLGWCV
jgi:hypothetical protein